MPIVTAAVAAVAAAVAMTTVATVATAVVAVATVVGVAGLAVTAVGMATGNKDLLKAGKIMGYVGLAGGLAGGLIGGVGGLMEGGAGFMEGAMGAYEGAAQHTAEAWDEGIGSFFAADPSATTAVEGAAAPTVDAPKNFVPNEVNPGINNAAPSMSTGTPTAADLEAAAYGPPIEGPSAVSGMPASAPTPVPVTTTPPATPVATDAAQSAYQGTLNAAQSPAGLEQEALGRGIVEGTKATAPAAAVTPPPAGAGMPQWAQYAAMTAGAQGLTGLASGYFQGLNAEQQLEFQKLVNEQKQQQLAITNQRGAYSPLVSFKPRGALNTVKT